MAWGDLDGDGDPDLAVGNAVGSASANRVYLNNGGSLESSASWSSTETDNTHSVAWGDVDGDGDLDLAVGNTTDQPNLVYLNNAGTLESSASWSSETGSTFGVAWGDMDGDGDLDLAVVNFATNRVYENSLISDPTLPNNPTHAVVYSPGSTDAAPSGFSTAEQLPGPILPVPFALMDAESDPAVSVRLEYSTSGGGQWWSATTSGATTELATSPAGTTHSLDWDIQTDTVVSDNTVLRLVVEWQSPTLVSFPVQQGQISTSSAPFRVALDADGDGSNYNEDCDDNDANNFPGNTEVCDGADNDCDGLLGPDELDDDGDGQTECDGDCDDGRSDVSPEGAEASAEACADGLDNDCDGLVDLDDEDCDEFADDDSVGDWLQGGGCSCGVAPTREVDLSPSVALGLLLMLGLRRRRRSTSPWSAVGTCRPR